MFGQFDKIMLEFPLCCLSYPEDNEQKVGMIISYCIVEHSKRVTSYIHKRIRELERKLPSDFEDFNELHSKVVLAADEMGKHISSVQKTLSNHQLICEHITTYTEKYGKDAFCRIGKDVCFETKAQKFDYSLFAVLCAIQSILGKKKSYCKITKDRIRYRMQGYRSKKIAYKEMIDKSTLFSDRQIGNRINILYGKKFFSKFTYAQRQTFYSTKLTDEELREKVGELKLYWAEKKSGIKDIEKTEEIKNKMKIIKLKRKISA